MDGGSYGCYSAPSKRPVKKSKSKKSTTRNRAKPGLNEESKKQLAETEKQVSQQQRQNIGKVGARKMRRNMLSNGSCCVGKEHEHTLPRSKATNHHHPRETSMDAHMYSACRTVHAASQLCNNPNIHS